MHEKHGIACDMMHGFDQPKLVAMVVDKKLSGVACVQTLSRLNRMTAQCRRGQAVVC